MRTANASGRTEWVETAGAPEAVSGGDARRRSVTVHRSVHRGALLPPCDDHEVAENLQDHVGLASA